MILHGVQVMAEMKLDIENIHEDSVNATIDFIQAHGVMVSNRWFIGEEADSNGSLIIRDEISSQINGVNARYMFPINTALNF
jgi:hypothetical protein